MELDGTVYTTDNTVLLLEDIGEGEEEALICRTDRVGCCQNPGIGNWLNPNTQNVGHASTGDDIYRSRGTGNGAVFLRRRNNAVSPLGTYCCRVPTAASPITPVEFCVFLSKSIIITLCVYSTTRPACVWSEEFVIP